MVVKMDPSRKCESAFTPYIDFKSATKPSIFALRSSNDSPAFLSLLFVSLFTMCNRRISSPETEATVAAWLIAVFAASEKSVGTRMICFFSDIFLQLI